MAGGGQKPRRTARHGLRAPCMAVCGRGGPFVRRRGGSIRESASIGGRRQGPRASGRGAEVAFAPHPALWVPRRVTPPPPVRGPVPPCPTRSRQRSTFRTRPPAPSLASRARRRHRTTPRGTPRPPPAAPRARRHHPSTPNGAPRPPTPPSPRARPHLPPVRREGFL